jgi:hypothetical protein
MVMTCFDDFPQMLMKTLGLPTGTKWFEVRVEAGEDVIVRACYTPQTDQDWPDAECRDGKVTCLNEYVLVKKKEAPCP